MQQKNLLLFLVLSLLTVVLYTEAKRRFFPPPPRPPVQPTPQARENDRKNPRPILGLALGPVAALSRVVPPAPPRKVRLPSAPPITPEKKLVTLGEQSNQSRFHLQVVFDPRGASVRRVLLNKFQKTTAEGRPAWEDLEHKVPAPLELVPDGANELNPSFLLYLYNPNKPGEDRPLDTLGLRDWEVAGEEKDGPRQSVSFRTEVPEQGLIVTKTYTIGEGEYHVGLKVKLERMPGDAGPKDLQVRYQLTGAHGLPIEGRWYTSTFRNALIAREDGGRIDDREYQDLRQINLWQGGDAVVRGGGKYLIRYAGVAVQYFASVIVVDDRQEDQNFLSRARPTLEVAVTKGQVKSIDSDTRSFVLAVPGSPREETFYALEAMPNALAEKLEPNKALFVAGELVRVGQELAVVHFTDSEFRQIATEVGSAGSTQALFEDDITVRVVTEPVDLKAGESVEHSYLLYQGPVKPSLLADQKGAAAVSPELISRYVDKLHLNTLTDYHSPGWMGTFASTIGWSWLIIFFTNVMHWVLHVIYGIVHNYGIAIILLTVLVRAMMFPLSRKQALTSIKMQALAPEMKKMTEKFKDDKQGLAVAQMELYRKYGINPFGTCWLLLFQMPVFMGLYYALQESIDFRLAPFWGAWIINLAAPDMLWHWGSNIPWISRPADYGSLLYLGPYFNLLPVIAVSLMLVQQKMMTPPPTDEQQEMQMKIMKFMMIFMGLMFYKVAAGLCVYFIASSLWGFAERKLLPKFSHDAAVAADAAAAVAAGAPASVPRPALPPVSTEIHHLPRKQGRNKKKDRGRQEIKGPRGGIDKEDSASILARLRKRLSDWWAEVLRQAQKK